MDHMSFDPKAGPAFHRISHLSANSKPSLSVHPPVLPERHLFFQSHPSPNQRLCARDSDCVSVCWFGFCLIESGFGLYLTICFSRRTGKKGRFSLPRIEFAFCQGEHFFCIREDTELIIFIFSLFEFEPFIKIIIHHTINFSGNSWQSQMVKFLFPFWEKRTRVIAC